MCPLNHICQALFNAVSIKYMEITGTKVRFMKSLIWSIATYGCEGWTLKADQRRIEAFEMWGFRRLLRIPWTQQKTNEWILEKLSDDRQLLNSIKTRKIRYYGHVMRKPSCLEKDIVQGCISGSRSGDGQRT